MTGGSGADRLEFGFLAPGEIDTITDFAATDVFVMQRFWFGTSRALIMGSDPIPVTGSDRRVFLYDTDTGVLSIDKDGDGAGAALAFVTLLNAGSAAILTADQVLLAD